MSIARPMCRHRDVERFCGTPPILGVPYAVVTMVLSVGSAMAKSVQPVPS